MTLQYFFVTAVLMASVAYAVWRIHKAFKIKSGDPCYGCALKKVCRKDLYKEANTDDKNH